jgi:hypothetical protein
MPFEAEAVVAVSPPTLTLQKGATTLNKFRLQIAMPSQTPWLSTDFPIVEGRTLFEIETTFPPSGQWKLQPMLPIRGEYLVKVDTGGGASQVIKLQLDENPVKILNFAWLAIVLALVGFAGGYLIGGKQETKEDQLAPTKIEVLLCVAAIVAIVAMFTLAAGAEIGTHNNCQRKEVIGGSDQLMATGGCYSLEFSGSHAIDVGDLAKFTALLKDTRTNLPVANVPVEIAVIQSEEQFTDLAFTALTDERGEVSWKQTFFDGAPHKVNARVIDSKGTSLKTWLIVRVVPIHPPLARRLIGLAYMVAFLIAGFVSGFLWSRRRKA